MGSRRSALPPPWGHHTRCQSHRIVENHYSCRLEGSGRGPKRSKADGRVRQRGAGRKLLTHHAPDIVQALDALVEPSSRGDPESLLRWTCKSTRRLAQELQRQGYNIGDRKVADLLRQLNYSLQANAKTLEGRQHPDRNAQFEYINTLSKRFYRRCQPVISVDTKKKELVGDFKNAGREWQPQGQPEETRVHDFLARIWARPFPTGYAIWPITAAGPVWGWTTTPQSLPSTVSCLGGSIWGAKAIRKPMSC